MHLLKIVIAILVVLVILSIAKGGKITKTFGLSGYKKPANYLKLNDPRPDLSGYSLVEGNVDNDMMEKFVIGTNKELYKRLGFSTYIIETQSIKVYQSSQSSLYECTFTTVRNGGFAFGFVVVATFEVVGSKTKLVSLRSQPMNDQSPSDVKVYTKGSAGKEFLDYKLVKESAIPNISELDSIKNKLS